MSRTQLKAELGRDLKQRFPDVNVKRLLAHTGRASVTTVNTVLHSIGRGPVECPEVVADSAWRVKQLAGLARPIPVGALDAAIAVVDHGLSVAAAAKLHGRAWATVHWAAERLRHQRAS